MNYIFALGTFILLLALILGLIYPRIFSRQLALLHKEPSRKNILVTFGSATLAFFILTGITTPSLSAENFNYEFESEDFHEYMVNGDDLVMNMSGGPLYEGSVQSFEPHTAQYEKLRSQKVDEILRITNDAIGEIYDLHLEMNGLRYDYLGYVQEFNQYIENPELSEALRKSIYEQVALHTNSTAKIGVLLGLKDTGFDNANRATALANYQKVMTLGQAYESLLTEYGQIGGVLAGLVVTLGDSVNQKAKELAQNIDREFPKKFEKLGSKFNDFNELSFQINIGFSQLQLGDIAFFNETIHFIAAEISKLKTQIAEFTPNETFDQEDLEFLSANLEFLEAHKNTLTEQLEAFDLSHYEFLIAAVSKGNVAYAGFFESLGNAAGYLGTKISNGTAAAVDFGGRFAENTGAAVQIGWHAIKTTASAAKSGTGLLLDTVGATTKSGADVIFNTWEGNYSFWPSELGNTVKDMVATTDKNFRKVQGNWEKGDSGSEYYKGAIGILDAAEDVVRINAEVLVGKAFDLGESSLDGLGRYYGLSNSLTEDIIGKQRFANAKQSLTWLAGGTAKLTAGIFTGMAKGAYKVLDIKSTTSDLVSGGLDLAFALTGGSKLLMKTSQAGKSFVSKAFQYFTKKGAAEAGKKLAKEGTKDAAEELVSRTLRQKIVEGITKVTKKTLEKGKGTLDEISGGLDDLFKAQYESTLKGLAHAIKDAVAKNGIVDLIDNLGAGLIDPYLNQALTYVSIKTKEYYDSMTDESSEGTKSLPNLESLLCPNISCVEIFKNLAPKAEAESVPIQPEPSSQSTSTPSASIPTPTQPSKPTPIPVPTPAPIPTPAPTPTPQYNTQEANCYNSGGIWWETENYCWYEDDYSDDINYCNSRGGSWNYDNNFCDTSSNSSPPASSSSSSQRTPEESCIIGGGTWEDGVCCLGC